MTEKRNCLVHGDHTNFEKHAPRIWAEILWLPTHSWSRSENFSQEKRSTSGAETAWWGGGLPRERVVAEKFVPSLESLFSLGLEGRNLGCPGIFVGMSRTFGGSSKSLCKKIVLVFRPLKIRDKLLKGNN